jgi:hypothetical protein
MEGKAFIFPDEPIEGDDAKLSLSKTGNYDIAEVTICNLFGNYGFLKIIVIQMIYSLQPGFSRFA